VPTDQPQPIKLPDYLWNHPDVLHACRQHDAPALLRIIHRDCDITQARIAHWMQEPATTVTKLVNHAGSSGHPPKLSLLRWRRIADALNMPDRNRALISLTQHSSTAANQDPFTIDSPQTTLIASDPPPANDGAEERHPTRAAADRAIDSQLLRALNDMLAQYVRTDNLLGPRPLLATVTAQLYFVNYLRTMAPDRARTRLFEIAAHYAEFAGWLHQDAGDLRAAEYWTDRSLEWALASQSSQMISYVLTRKSNQASALSDSSQTLALAQAALREMHRLNPRTRIRALALRQVARGHALEGNADAALGALDQARICVSDLSSESDNDRSLAGYCTPAYIELEAADCWILLRRPRQAVALFERTLATWPDLYRRDRAVHLARLAVAYAADNELDHARSLAQEATALGNETGSARATDELHRVTQYTKAPITLEIAAPSADDPPSRNGPRPASASG
jgi:tetratricopeptide (TPR) repeat protein